MSTRPAIPAASSRRFAVAPMMDWTDRHCRFFHRLMTRRALLYTEMLTANAVVHGDRARLLAFDPAEHPVALQLGGADADALARATAIGVEAGFDEINLNCGCPSDRVQGGRFGACLMAEPALVARLYRAMADAAGGVPVTVKCRIGIDDQDSESDLARFAGALTDVGCRTLIVHARKAWLAGLSPKENREIPPLDYERVYRLKAANPGLTVVINGGIGSLEEAEAHLRYVDGVMLGRAAYQTPYLLAEVDQRLFGEAHPVRARSAILSALIAYAERQLTAGVRLHAITRHILGLYHGRPNGRLFRRILSEGSARREAGIAVIEAAMAAVESESPARPAAE
jgi:tRNA-dihydrouridine synthase A